ncbi:MAG: hypothetical protein U0X40_09905 [Ferruginibacter sp.]
MIKTTGYSGTPLWKKLGITDKTRLLVLHEPAAYAQWLGIDINPLRVKSGEVPGLVHLFVKDKKALLACLQRSAPLCRKNPSLVIWVSWYKKAAGIATDLTEDIIRSEALRRQLVDVKVCAVSDEWSGLKLVVPLALR